ncbi:hypothetical protein RND81_08G016600 [Saponaria officinalis]|uniref:CCHC-type domain-containing protein n=1 Tax=Saponaria officinalis TaxID=3572 RepID=A0AAW1J1K9_SAPOF
MHVLYRHRVRFGGYRFGYLQQVAVKPLVHKVIDCPIYMALRDNRLNSYKDSLLAVVQTNVCNGSVYFNCFPDFTVDLSDPLILESLILDLHISENKFKEFSKIFAIVFRIYFRLMSSTVNPKFIHGPSSKEETIFIEVHAKDNKTKSLVEEDDKRVLLRFGSFRENTSTPSTPSSSFIPPRRSCSQLNFSNTRYRVYNKTSIPEYEATSSPPQSPTASDFQSVNTITEEFEINKEYLRDDFNSPQNNAKRKWFLSFEKEIKDEICNIWYKERRKLSINIPFFLWFDLCCQRLDIINPYCFPSIQVQSKLAQNWNLTDGRTVTSVHPPPKSFKFPQGDKEYINKTTTLSNSPNHSISSRSPNKLASSSESSNPTDLLQKISSSLLKLSSKQVNVIKNPLNKDITSESEESSDFEDNISQIVEQFKNNQKVNKIRNSWKNTSTRNYYSRPSPPDIQYEERSKFKAHQYSPDTIHEWNIDGKYEYEILNTLQEMGMATAAYKKREANIQVIFGMLIAGFTGQLKNWWDNSLTLQDQLDIMNHKTIYEQNDGMLIEVNDCCDFLIITIGMYFVGNPQEELSFQKTILTNLRCPTLSDYRWYKDMFLTYVLRRQDCNEGFWKEKFISGLPNLFSQRITRKLKEAVGTENVAYQNITYGQLFAFVKEQGLALCEELKIQSKYNSEKRQSKKELGCFSPSSKHRSQLRKCQKKRYNSSKSKYQPSPPKYYQKRKPKKYSKKQGYNKEIICFKCGKPGHKADKCFTKKKINELFQDNPEMCQKLSKLFLKSSSEEESNDEINIIQESSEEESYDSASSSPILMVNVISDKDDKTFLFDLIDKVEDPDIKRNALLRLRSIVIQE